MNKEEKELRKIEKNKDIAFAKEMKAKDGNKCAICGRVEYLHTHHIIPREDREFRHDPMNVITLCAKHHKFSLDISPHRNAFCFFLWLMENRIEKFNYLKNKLGGNDE